VECPLCAFLELFHSGEHANSAAIDITAPDGSASSCNDQIPQPERARTRVGERSSPSQHL
jgi:hypothetical protein